MKTQPGTKPLLLLLGILISAQFASYRGCELPDIIVPTPPVPVATEGLHVVLVHKTIDTTPQLASLKVKLRNGDAAAYLLANKHVLDIVPAETLPAETKAIIGEIREVPSVFFIDRKTDKLLGSMALAPDSTVETILSRIKEFSGAN